MGQAKEHYRPQPIPANGSAKTGGAHMGGFLAVTAGTLTVTDKEIDPTTGLETVLLAAMPVAVGWNRIPILFQSAQGGTVQLGGGASGSVCW